MSLPSEIKKGIACDSVGKPESAIGRAICLSVHPGKMLLFPLLHWYRYHYAGRYRFARSIFTLDLVLIGIVLTLTAVAITVTWLRPPAFADRITFDATIAPREVTTGAPATIVIRYTNGTNEELRDVELSLIEPRYFIRQEAEGIGKIGTIPPGGSENIHVKGVMFGDVGGEQAFQTKMTFVHGTDEDIPGEKIDWQVFEPTRSALALTLELPPRLVPFQTVEGFVRYQNTAEIAFPIVSILPEWPDGFVFTRSDARLRRGQFEIPSVDPGQTGEFKFEGILQEAVEKVTFQFHPSFTFGDDRFAQETLVHTAPVVALPITLHHEITAKTLAPGSSMPVTVAYTNTSDKAIENVVLAIESNSPFFQASESVTIEIIAPGETGEHLFQFNIKPFILQTQTTQYEHLTLVTRPTATYALSDAIGQRVVSKGSALEFPLTTPVRLDAFVRYFAPSGDQIGRGPLPPEPGRETTYWIFWNIAGTTNELTDARIEATLPEGVRFTGRQTVSQNGKVAYDPEAHTVTWTSDEVAPTFASASKIVGVAFEVGITPETEPQTALILVEDIRLTATDGFTGAFVSDKSPNLNWPIK